MAYGVKYRVAYFRKSGNRTTIDILQRDYSGSITSFKAGYPLPLRIFFEGNVSNIYERSVIGTGCELQICVPSLSMLDLFTEDLQEYIIKIYNGNSGENLIWQGFLDAGMYTENYSNPMDKIITIYGNDGISVLEKTKYVGIDSEGEIYNYSGQHLLKEIMDNILEKLEISFTHYCLSSDICYMELDGHRNLFLSLELAEENFYDESGVPKSCREVLEMIFGSMGLLFRFVGDKIVIFDPINLHDTEKNGYYFVSTGGIDVSYDGMQIGGYLDISGYDIDWGKTGSRLDIIPSIHNVRVRYDPYTFVGVSYNFNDENNWKLNPGSFTYYQSTPDFWLNSGYTSGLRFNYWSCINESNVNINGFGWEGYKDGLYNDPVYYIKLGDHNVRHIFNPPNTFVGQDENLMLSIRFKAYVNTKHINNLSSTNESTLINRVAIPVLIKVGNQINQDGGYSWGSSETYLEVRVLEEGVSPSNPEDSVINDVWTDAVINVPIGQTVQEILLSGPVEIRFLDKIRNYFSNQILPTENADAVFNILIKDVEVVIVHKDSGRQISNDGVETEAYPSDNPALVSKDSVEFTSEVGIGTNGCSRGAFRTQFQPIQGAYMQGLYREPIGSPPTLYSCAELLLQSVVSQYKIPRFKLSGVLNVKDYLLSVWFKLIKDSNYLGERAFYMCTGEYDDLYETIDCELIEVTDTREELL